MRATTLAFGLVIAWTAGGCGGARRTLERSLAAGEAGDWATLEATFVTPPLLEEVLECDADGPEWLTAEHRRAWLAEMRSRRHEFPDDVQPMWPKKVELLSFEPEDQDEDWKTHRAGELYRDGCRVRETFHVEEYRIVLRITDRFDSTSEPSLPVDFWRVGFDHYLWDDPLD